MVFQTNFSRGDIQQNNFDEIQNFWKKWPNDAQTHVVKIFEPKHFPFTGNNKRFLNFLQILFSWPKPTEAFFSVLFSLKDFLGWMSLSLKVI